MNNKNCDDLLDEVSNFFKNASEEGWDHDDLLNSVLAEMNSLDSELYDGAIISKVGKELALSTFTKEFLELTLKNVALAIETFKSEIPTIGEDE